MKIDQFTYHGVTFNTTVKYDVEIGMRVIGDRVDWILKWNLLVSRNR